jgi:hypothetical protein
MVPSSRPHPFLDRLLRVPLRGLPALLGLALSTLTLGTGCGSGLVPLTQELRDQHGLTEQELSNLQYYVSHTITLRRELESGGRQITGNHKLVLRAGKTIEEVVVPDGTPGVAVGVGADSLEISFEEGTSILFAIESAQPRGGGGGSFAVGPDPNPFPGSLDGGQSQPEPFPAKGNVARGGNYWVAIDSADASVPFAGTVFKAVDETLKAHLLIDAESLEEVVEQRTVLGGRKL